MTTLHGFEVDRVRDLPGHHGGQTQVLWKVAPPIKYGQDWSDEKKYEGESQFVVTSSVIGPFAFETYAFPADEDGEIVDWGELPGSTRVPNAHVEVINAINHDGAW